MKKVAVVYHYYAHYREPIMNELAEFSENEYYFICGNSTDVKIKTINFSENAILKDRCRIVKNVWIFKKFLWQKGLINIVLKDDFDYYIFLGSSFHLSTWVATIIARLKNKKVYFWMHGFYQDKMSSTDFIKVFLFYKLPNGFFLYGYRALKRLAELKVAKPESMYVIYNSLDYNKIILFRKSIALDSIVSFRMEYFKDFTLPVVVFVGRVNSIKRLDLLIEAQNLLYLKHEKVTFNIIIIGDGSEMDSLRSLVDKYFYLSKHVYFAGAIYDEKTNATMLSLSDLCVTPGEVGLTAIHSLSYGTPVISHNNFNLQMPEVESIVPGVTGDFYNYGDLTNLAEKIHDWFNNNPIKSKDIINNCYKIVDSYFNPKFQRLVFDKVLK